MPNYVIKTRADSISNIVAEYYQTYSNCLTLSITKTLKPCASPHTNFFVYQTPIERSAQKYYGYMILQALKELVSSSSSHPQEQKAFQNIFIFGRPKDAQTPSIYSAIHSVLIPGYFYIEIGHFDSMVFETNAPETPVRDTAHLELLKSLGVVPFLDSVLRDASRIFLCPAGKRMLNNENSQFSYDLQSTSASHLTTDALNRFIACFSKQIDAFTKTHDSMTQRSSNPDLDQFYKHVMKRACQLRGALTQLIPKKAIADSDSDDDFDNGTGFYLCFPKNNVGKSADEDEEDMGSYAAYKNR